MHFLMADKQFLNAFESKLVPTKIEVTGVSDARKGL